MEDKPLVSIIIPVYNVSKYLSRCVDSILCQTYENFELLLIDDGSTDDSGCICDTYSCKDIRIKTFHKKNGGPSSSRNYGLDVANGDWIIFIDSDDYVSDDYIETFFKYNKSFNEKVHVVQGFHVFSDDESINYKEIHYSYTELCTNGTKIDYRIGRNRFFHSWAVWGKLFSKQIIDENKIRFNENVYIFEDGMFWHRYILYVQKIIYLAEQNYYYYRPKESISITSIHKLNISELKELCFFYKMYSTQLIRNYSLDKEYANEIIRLYWNRFFSLIKTFDICTFYSYKSFFCKDAIKYYKVKAPADLIKYILILILSLFC